MQRVKLSDTAFKLVSVILAIVILCSSAYLLATELGKYVNVADAKSASADVFVPNDLTSGLNEVFLPNYDTEVITKTNLKRPKVETFGIHEASYYPSYINQLSSADFGLEKKKEIWEENEKIIADTKAWYQEGTLKQNLKKHVSADGQFSATGNYDNAPRIEKVISINSKNSSRRRSLGTFAPAGEIITITIDESLVGKLTLNIGYPYVGECNIGSRNDKGEINTGKFDRWHSERMAILSMSFSLNSTVNYIGSPFGGMLSLNGFSGTGDFKITVSGAVDMPDYKLGVSTKQDWKNILKAPGPYVWLLTPYQYFVMPKTEISDIDDPYNALLWWHKVSMISMYSMAREDTGHFLDPVISIYDSYVYIGEGVAAAWAFVTNAPKYWCHGMMDYDNLMSSGAWGAIHEYNHHHQAHTYSSAEWGVGYSDEITNNVLNAISYILLTDIAATRSEKNNLGGWVAVSDPYCNYKRLDNVSKSTSTYEGFDTSKLFGYVDLMHTFGTGKFIDFIRAQYGYGQVEGYEGENLTTSNYLRSQDGFALFASLFYKTDFVDYFTNVWHYDISDDTVKKIKSYGFDEYFSVNNLYSVGVKGIETGRAFKVNASGTTVLKFNQYTICSTDNYTLDSVSKPKNGKLTDNGDGTYSYTPSKNFTEDSFNLTYKVALNGKTYTRTLVVRLVPNYNYIDTVTYNVDSGKTGLSAEEAIAEFVKKDNVLSTDTASNFTSGTASGVNITSFKAQIAFPTSYKKVTFMVFADDKAYLKIDGKTAFTSSYIANVNGAKGCETNKITMSVKAGEPLQVEAYCFNTGGGGSLSLKYSVDDGNTYQDIPSSYCYASNLSKKDIKKISESKANVYSAPVDFRNLYLNRWYSDSIVYTPTEAKCLDNDGNEVKTVNGANINALFDGTTSTTFHTAWQGAKTPYPHNYYITFEKNILFNCINIYAHNNSNYYSIGEYEIYTSADGTSYELVKEGTNQGGNFSIRLDKMVLTKYVKIVVKSNASGQSFTNLSEIQFAQTLDLGTDYNVFTSKDNALNYKSKWTEVSGNFINSKAMSTSKGNVRFYLTGTNLMLYSTNGVSTIKIDGKTYTIKANDKEYTPSFIIDGLSNTKHLVEIEGVGMTLDMIKTTGFISGAQDPINWTAMGVSIGLGVVLAGSGLAVIATEVENKRKLVA